MDIPLTDFELASIFDTFQEVSFASPIFLILVLIIIALMIVGVPLYAQICKLRSHIAESNQKLQILGILFNQASDARCGWFGNSREVFFTEVFAKLLGLNPLLPIALTDIQNQVAPKDSLELTHDIQTLILEGKGFSRTLSLRNDSSQLSIQGTLKALGPLKLYQLVAHDSFSENQVIEESNAKIRSLMMERDILKLLVDKAPIALWFRDEEGKIKYCNKLYANYLESPIEEVVRGSKELIPASRMGSPYQLSVKARTTRLKQQQRTHIVIDGQRRYFEIIECAPTDQESTIGFALDLTETEEIKAELNLHIRSHQELLQHLSTPLAYFGPDKRLQLFNQAYMKLFDFEETWLYSKPAFGEILEQLRKSRKLPEYTDFQKFKSERMEFFHTLLKPFEELLHQPDGQVIRVMIAPHPLGGLLYLFDDITEKLKLERKYNILMAVQKHTLDQLYEGITVFASDNKLSLSNPAAGRIWRLTDKDRESGRHLSDLLEQIKPFFQSAHEWERLQRRLTHVFSEREEKTGQILLMNKTVIRYTYVPLPDGSHLVSFVDVSDSWRIEHALKERNNALEQVDRLKTDFISHVSYELKAPLNSVLGFAEILSNQYFGKLNEKQDDYCKGIIESSERLLALINDILDLANIEAGTLSIQKKSIHLNDFMDRAVNLVHNRANDQGLEIVQENNTDLTEFTGDELRLKQAIFNLLTNAIKFTSSGGRIVFKAETTTDQQGHSFLIFVVEDNGVGITPENQAVIFKLFEKAAPGQQAFHPGAGLGLPLVKSLIELHGGSIAIRSAPDKGTRVACKIPLDIQVAQPSSAEGEPDQKLIEDATLAAKETTEDQPGETVH